MTERQREVLDALAHIRMAPELAWASSRRVGILTGRTDGSTRGVLRRLENAGLVERVAGTGMGRHLWRITGKGRAAL